MNNEEKITVLKNMLRGMVTAKAFDMSYGFFLAFTRSTGLSSGMMLTVLPELAKFKPSVERIDALGYWFNSKYHDTRIHILETVIAELQAT